MKNKKVVIDTNLWISFLISNKMSEIDELILNKTIKLIFSEELIEEFIAVVQRPKFQKYFTENEVIALLEIIQEFAEIISVSSNLQLCRDQKDNFLLNLCVDGKADFLITGDDDLLVLKNVGETKIVNWKEFIKNINQ